MRRSNIVPRTAHAPKQKAPTPMGSGQGNSRFDEGHKQIVLEAISRGCYATEAAALAGMSENALYVWLKKGAELDDDGNPIYPPYHEFYQAFQLARARNIDARLKSITEQGDKDWKAHAWYLERVYPNKFGRKERIDIGTEEPIKVTLSWE